MDDWKLMELAFDLLENAKEGEKIGSQIYLLADERTWTLFKEGIRDHEEECPAIDGFGCKCGEEK